MKHEPSAVDKSKFDKVREAGAGLFSKIDSHNLGMFRMEGLRADAKAVTPAEKNLAVLYLSVVDWLQQRVSRELVSFGQVIDSSLNKAESHALKLADKIALGKK